VASSSGRRFSQRLSAPPRKVGTPLAAEMPAPVSAATRLRGVNEARISAREASGDVDMEPLP